MYPTEHFQLMCLLLRESDIAAAIRNQTPLRFPRCSISNLSRVSIGHRVVALAGPAAGNN
jgi:hypothetical protein